MPRIRKNQTEAKKDEEVKQHEDYALQFSRSFVQALNGTPYLNPFLQNEILKKINLSPQQFDRDQVEKLIKNPQQNEQALRNLAQYLDNYVMHFKRVARHYATILSFDNYLEPTNADDEDMKTTAFKKSYKKAVDWLDKFNPKKTFTDVMIKLMFEDANYYYLRESEDGYVLQEMPSAYCKIVRKTDYGYQYAFNMLYFLQLGVDINDYAPEFGYYWANYTQKSEYANNAPYWQELDPLVAPVFKFDENNAASIPPLMGLFIDTTEIATYKELLKTKTKLEVWKVLLSKIPMNTDTKNGGKNNFLIDADTAGKFNNIVQNALPEGVKHIVTPFETESFDFKQAENKSDIAGIGEEMFYRTSGSSPMLFGEKNTNGTGIQLSVKTDEGFVDHMYHVFERFVNTQLKRVTGKYRFKIHFEGTRFDKAERIENAMKAVSVGAPKTYLACAMGKTLDEFINLSNFENSIELVEKMRPTMSAHTQNGDGGRPNKTDGTLTSSGQQTRDNGSNQNR